MAFSRTIQDLRANRRSAVIALVVVVALVLGVGVWWWREHRDGLHIRGEFTAAVGIYPGNDVRILGVKVGKVTSVTPDGREVTVAMTLDPGVDVRADTDAAIITPNLVSDRYVQLTGAYSSGPKLADGTTLGLSRTRTPVELDQLYGSLISLFTALGPKGANKTGSLSRLLRVGAANLSGTGAKINKTVGDLSKSSSTLAGSRKNIFGTIKQLSVFTHTLAQHNSQLAGANADLAGVTNTLAADRTQFGEALRNLAGALLLVKSFVQQHRSALSANVHRLSRVAVALGRRQTSLAQALHSAPQLLQNFLDAYDPNHKLLRGRADLNELTVWARQHATSGATSDATSDATSTSRDTSTATTSAAVTTATSSGDSSTLPSLLPAVGQAVNVP